MRLKLVLLAVGCLCILSAQALAVSNVFVMTANDALGTSSFNAAGSWSPAGAPAPGTPPDTNDYSTVGYLLRGPASGTGPYVFAGDSLTVGGGNGGGANPFQPWGPVNNNSLKFKVNGQTLTVNNLILDAGTVRDGNATNNIEHLTGNMYVTSNGGQLAAQSLLYIDSLISGPGPLYIGDNGNNDVGRQVILTSPSSTYAGNIIMTAGGQTTPLRCRLTFDVGSIMNFTIGSSGVNNTITGMGTLTLNGNFNFDLSGASTNLGDSWSIVGPTTNLGNGGGPTVAPTTTYGATFAPVGFTDIGGDLWNKDANGVTYQFSEATGALTVVPEPAAWIMLLLGAMGIAIYSRKK
jgi:hypothetical protein